MRVRVSVGLGLRCLGDPVGWALHPSTPRLDPPRGTVLPAVSSEPQQCLLGRLWEALPCSRGGDPSIVRQAMCVWKVVGNLL